MTTTGVTENARGRVGDGACAVEELGGAFGCAVRQFTSSPGDDLNRRPGRVTTTARLRWPVGSLRLAAGAASAAVIADLVGVRARTVCRWNHHGLTDIQADHAAIALALHPVLVWPDWFSL